MIDICVVSSSTLTAVSCPAVLLSYSSTLLSTNLPSFKPCLFSLHTCYSWCFGWIITSLLVDGQVLYFDLNISKTTCPDFTKFSIPVAMARSSFDSSAIRCVLPVLWMTSCFHVMEQIGQIEKWHVSSSSPSGTTGAKLLSMIAHLF